jgi:hypothetical protein
MEASREESSEVARDMKESGRLVIKKGRPCLMSRASLASMRAQMTATGQMDSSFFHNLSQLGRPVCPVLSVLERYAGTKVLNRGRL